MNRVSTPTNEEIIRTFHLFSDRQSMLCSKHGVFLDLVMDLTPKCPICMKGLERVPSGTIPVYDEKVDRG